MTNNTTQTNEIAVQENGIVLAQSRIVSENENYIVLVDADGKHVRKAKYQPFSSVKAESREDKIWLMNLMDGAEDSGTGLKDAVGKTIEVANVIFNPYDKINEIDGSTEYGVLTYLITPEKEVYVTSAKAVYFTVKRIFDLFGTPLDSGWENIQLLVQKEKATNGDAIKVKMVG